MGIKNKNNQLKMKFALLALVATVASIRLSAPAQCVSAADSDAVFKKVDTNGNGQVSKKELTVAVTTYLKENKIHPTEAQVAAFTKAAEADAGADKTLSPAEFNSLANQVANYLDPAHCSA